MAARIHIQLCLVINLLMIGYSAGSGLKRIKQRVNVLEVRFDAETRFRREDMSNLMDKMDSISSMFNGSAAEAATCQRENGKHDESPPDSHSIREISKVCTNWRHDFMQLTKAFKDEKKLNIKIRGQFPNIVNNTRMVAKAMDRMDERLDKVSADIASTATKVMNQVDERLDKVSADIVSTVAKTILNETTANQMMLLELVNEMTGLKQELNRVHKTLENVSEERNSVPTNTTAVLDEARANLTKLTELTHEMAELKQELRELKENSTAVNKLKQELRELKENCTKSPAVNEGKDNSTKGTVVNERKDNSTKSTVVNERPSSCVELYEKGHRVSGQYDVFPEGRNTPIRVYCDQDTDGGGWTVVQRRKDGTEDFYRNWSDYRNGFGKLGGEFWLGNNYLSILASRCCRKLRIDMEDFEGGKRYAVYDEFQIGSEDENYKLKIGNYSGDAGDSLIVHHNSQQFSTKDRDNDNGGGNCATRRKGGWWYRNCHFSNLNGLYHGGLYNRISKHSDGIVWKTWRGYWYSLKFTEMKFK